MRNFKRSYDYYMWDVKRFFRQIRNTSPLIWFSLAWVVLHLLFAFGVYYSMFKVLESYVTNDTVATILGLVIGYYMLKTIASPSLWAMFSLAKAWNLDPDMEDYLTRNIAKERKRFPLRYWRIMIKVWTRNIKNSMNFQKADV